MDNIIQKLEYILTDMEELPIEEWEVIWPQAVKLEYIVEELKLFKRREN